MFLSQTGGPLMYFDRKSSAWIASGIVSFGAEKCGTVGLPGVYVKVLPFDTFFDRFYSLRTNEK